MREGGRVMWWFGERGSWSEVDVAEAMRFVVVLNMHGMVGS